MALRLHNSLKRKLESFEPIEKGVVRIYNCGPTVYDFAHIGNFRAFLFADVLRRYLEYLGLRVKQVMNITDVGHLTDDADGGEDKIEAQAKKQRKTPLEIAAYYTRVFFDDCHNLNILAANSYPRATDFIPEMQEIISILLKKGRAYKVGKNIYFDVASFPSYGALSGNDIESLRAGSRFEVNPEKKHPADFALWIEDKKHIMGWRSPWGSHGYPGWHIECSAMVFSVLEAAMIDIHTGGEDNKFPHHECEIAQSESFTGSPFANFFLHAAHLLVDGAKMSKSFGNFYTLRDLEKKGFSGNVLRFFLLSGHYRQNLNLTFDALRAAQSAVKKIQDFIFSTLASKNGDYNGNKEILKLLKDFEVALNEDLNFPASLGAVFNFIDSIGSHKLSSDSKVKVIEAVKRINYVLGLRLEFELKIPLAIKKLVEERERLRNMGNFKKADEIRDKVSRLGYEVRDTEDEPVVIKAK